MFYDYKLRFKDEEQADVVLTKALKGLGVHQYVKHTIGQRIEYVHNTEEEEPEVVILDAGWHVDVRSTVELKFAKKYSVHPVKPLHTFA